MNERLKSQFGNIVPFPKYFLLTALQLLFTIVWYQFVRTSQQLPLRTVLTSHSILQKTACLSPHFIGPKKTPLL
jgi:hypothetical protein